MKHGQISAAAALTVTVLHSILYDSNSSLEVTEAVLSQFNPYPSAPLP